MAEISMSMRARLGIGVAAMLLIGAVVAHAGVATGGESRSPSDAAIDRVLAGLAGTSVSSVKLGVPRQGSLLEGAWVTVGLDRGDVDEPRSVWLGELVEGAAADLMHTDEETTSQVVRGGSIVGQASDGTIVERSLGHGSIRSGQRFDSPDDDTVRARVAEVGRRFGIAVRSLSLLHPLDTAIEVTFVVPDDSKVDWTIDELSDALEQSPPPSKARSSGSSLHRAKTC